MPAKYDRRRATVVAFDAREWEPPGALVVDTNVVAEALLRREPEHDVFDALFRRLIQARTLVVFSRLLEAELWEVMFNHALRTHTGSGDVRHSRFVHEARRAAGPMLDQAIRDWNELLDALDWQCVELHEVADAVPDLMCAYGLQSYDAVHAATLLQSGVTDMVTRDAGFAVLLPEDATLHTTRRRLSRTRARRRSACGV
ncbi:MAG TPA: type II toxin-antitoxin system VapC family toxin [Conexibacter sp.]|nr:type II toxin-antitoxin system VapC family toxin [Conexibacter sp.]